MKILSKYLIHSII